MEMEILYGLCVGAIMANPSLVVRLVIVARQGQRFLSAFDTWLTDEYIVSIARRGGFPPEG